MKMQPLAGIRNVAVNGLHWQKPTSLNSRSGWLPYPHHAEPGETSPLIRSVAGLALLDCLHQCV